MRREPGLPKFNATDPTTPRSAQSEYLISFDRKGMIAIDVLYLVDRLEALISKGWRVPLSSKTMIDEDEFLDIVDQMRLAFPDEMKHAKRVTQERDQILQNAQAQAAHIIESAKIDLGRLTDDHAVKKAAEERAMQIGDQAKMNAASIRRGADEYAEQVLRDLQTQLTDVSKLLSMFETQIANGLAELRGPMPPESAEDLDGNP